MAEQEITYIPYGLDEISLLDLMTSLANGVDSYLNSRNWGKKAKYRDAWLRAYQDIMTQGITGASNDTGIWRINHNGPNIDLSNKSNIEREMYGDAAYYILQQMSQMTPRIKKEEKKDESSKTKFDNAAFNSGLTAYIGSSLYGGMSSDKWNERWANLDPEDRGIRGTAGRQKEMSNQLLNYLNKIELEKDKYSFEDTPYGSFDEWKNRATRAIAALNNPEWNDDDKNALNALGIDYNEWFKTGADEPVTLNDSSTMTRAEFNALEDKLNAEKAAAELKAALEKIALLKANLYNNYRFYTGYGTPISLENLRDIKSYVNNNILLGLTPLTQSELVWLFKNHPQSWENLTKEELAKFGPNYSKTPGRLKKISGINGVYWDTIGNRVVHPMGATLTNPNNDIQNIMDLNSPEALKEKQLNTPRQLSEGLKYEDYARIGAALGDVISLGGFWANVGGSIVSLLGDTTADIADDKVSTWEAVTNFGRNLGWTAAGFIPGGKLGKVAKHMLRWAPKLLVALNDYNLLHDESNKKTWNKLTSDRLIKEGLNDEDLKNITYWVRALTGTINAGKAAARDIKYSKARGTAGLEFTTKDGSKVTLSNKDVQEINVAGARKGLKAAEAKFKEKAKKATGTEHEAAEGTFKFSENGRSGLFKNTRSKLQDLQLQGKSTVFRTPELQNYYNLLKLDRNLGGFGGWRPFTQRGTSSYFDHFDNGFSFRNPLKGIGQKLDPYRNIIAETPVNNKIQEKSQVRAQQAKENLKKKEYSNPREEYNLKQQHRSEREIEQFLKSYGEKGKVSSNSFSKGYGSNTNKVKNGEITVELGDGTKFSYKVNNASDYNGNPGKVATLRGDVARKIQELLSSTKKVDRVKIGKILQDLKRKGWLKQGGTINNNDLDTIINDFLKK